MQFLSWMINKDVFFVTGSDKQKVDEPLPSSIMKRCDGVFCSMANEFWQKDKLIYRNKFNPDPHLKEMLMSFQMYTKFPIMPKLGGRGKIIEERPGMINFRTIGRNAGEEERKRYY